MKALLITTAAILALGTAAVLAQGKFSGTIELNEADPQWGDAVTFTVETGLHEKDLYRLYVTSQCIVVGSDPLQAVSKSEPVINGVAGPFTLGHSDWIGQGDCYAWAWTFGGPDIRGATISYSIEG